MKQFLSMLLVATFLLAACAPAATPVPTAAPTAADMAIRLTDGMNRAVSLAAPAKKIVSLAPSNTEILFAVGAGSQVIGRDDLSDYPAEVKKLPSVGGSMGKFNYEQLAQLQPDLVLASSLNTPEQIKAIEDLKLTVYVLANPTELNGLFANLVTVGTLSAHSDDAMNLVASLKTRQMKVLDALANLKDRPTVFYELDASDPAKPYTVGANTFIDILISMAGGKNIGANLKGDSPQISQEELLAQNPAVILLGDAAYGTAPDQVAKRPGWGAIQAVKDNKVFAFDDNTVSRPGPRMLDGLETLAKLLHPEAVK
jgi:iron complex transport system substrate-binding protein